MKGPRVGMKAAMTLKTALTPRQDRRVRLRPMRSDRLPHTMEPQAIPTRVMEPAIGQINNQYYEAYRDWKHKTVSEICCPLPKVNLSFKYHDIELI